MQIDPGLMAKLGASGVLLSPTFSVGSADFKRLVARDLECLLNTRKRPMSNAEASSRLVSTSLPSYGIVDFSSKYFENGKDVTDICDAMAQSIRLFEPRLKQVWVDAEAVAKSVRGLNIVIKAVLVADGIHEPVVFSAVFDMINKKYAISA
jgi:type VI secretion system protein ImpF